MRLVDLYETPYIANSINSGIGYARAVQLYQQYIEEKPSPIAKIHGFNVYKMSTKDSGFLRYRFLVLDPKGKDVTSAVKALLVVGEYFKGCFQVMISFVMPDVRGTGLGKQLYLTVINQGFTLLSDYSQSREAHNVWISLVKMPGLKSFAIKGDNPKERFPIEVKNNEIFIKGTGEPVAGNKIYIGISK